MPIVLQHRVYQRDLRNNPAAFYIFGDNERRVGRGGQAAECRDEPNAIGVATLAAPGCYWSDADYEHNCSVIDADLKLAFDAIAGGGIVVFPSDGIGTGLANLPHLAPRTFAYLTEALERLGVPKDRA